MIPSPYIEDPFESNTAQVLTIHVCGDEAVHIMMEDGEQNILADMVLDPEAALAIAKKIEHAADVALGIA